MDLQVAPELPFGGRDRKRRIRQSACVEPRRSRARRRDVKTIICALAIATVLGGCSSSSQHPAATTRLQSQAASQPSTTNVTSAEAKICDRYPAARAYEGITESAAIATGAPGGVRVIERDEVPLQMVRNLDADRVSLVVEHGRVSHACRF